MLESGGSTPGTHPGGRWRGPQARGTSTKTDGIAHMTERSSSSPQAAPTPLDRSLRELSDLREELLARVGSLPEEARAARPRQAPTAWTPTQVLQHLYLAEAMVLERMPPAGGEFTSGREAPTKRLRLRTRIRHRLGALAVRVVFRLGLRVRVPTQRVVPEPPRPFSEIASAWRDTQEEMAFRLKAAFARAPSAPTMRHPISGPLTPAKTAHFLLEHARHHARQLDRLGVPQSSAQGGNVPRTGSS